MYGSHNSRLFHSNIVYVYSGYCHYWSGGIVCARMCEYAHKDSYTLPQKSLDTLDGEIVDPEIAVELEMRDVPNGSTRNKF